MTSKRRGTVNRRWEVRVLVALPAVWVLFAVIEGYLAIQMTRSVLTAAVRPVRAIDEVTLVVIGGGSLVALACGVALALAVTRPVRGLLQKIKYRLRGEATLELTTANEIQQLSNAFDDMLLSFDKFVNDSQIVDGMPLGVVVIDERDTIIRANAEARRLLPGRVLEGSPVGELVGASGAAYLTGVLQRIRHSGMPVEMSPSVLFPERKENGKPQEVITLHPTTAVGEVVMTIGDLAYIETIRGHIQRVDQFAALGAHVASLAHELRGALMGIQTLTDAIQPHTPADATLHQKLQQELDRCVRLLSEIRGFGQASARQRRLCDLGRLVEDTVSTIEAQFSDRRVTVNRRIDPNVRPLLLDGDRTTQAVINVVTNAFEATPPGGTVTVVVERADGATLVRVANTGSFIPAEERQKIFTLFYTTKSRGSGFGLAMARRTLLDHGGEIALTSTPDAGTEFVLRFPDQLASTGSSSEGRDGAVIERQAI